MRAHSSFRGKLLAAATYVGIVGVTLIALDLLCQLLGVFPPPANYGNQQVGWLRSGTAPAVFTDHCLQASGKVVPFQRNEEGVRTSYSTAQLLADHEHFKVADTGDSQTDLC